MKSYRDGRASVFSNPRPQDDTDAINKAIAENSECSKGCYGSTTMGAIIYFPSGTYLVNDTIEISYGMQVIGDVRWFSIPPKCLPP